MKRYKAGMNEIKADEALKEQIIQHIKESGLDQRSHSFKIKRIALFLVTASLIILVAMFGISYCLDDSRATKTIEAEFHGIYITGFSKSGSPALVKPNVSFGEYSIYMSSVPGFPLKIEAVDADRIHLQVTEGSFDSWSPLKPKVIHNDKEFDVQSGVKFYYFPGFDSKYPETASSRIEITVFRKDKELGRETIEIRSKDGIEYTGMLLGTE